MLAHNSTARTPYWLVKLMGLAIAVLTMITLIPLNLGFSDNIPLILIDYAAGICVGAVNALIWVYPLLPGQPSRQT